MTTRSRAYPRRGEVYDVNFEPVIGSEIGKRRPAIIVSRDANNEHARTVTVVPLTGAVARRDYPFEVRVPRGVAGLSRDSRAKCDQIRTVDKRRVFGFRGALAEEYQALLERAIEVHLALS